MRLLPAILLLIIPMAAACAQDEVPDGRRVTVVFVDRLISESATGLRGVSTRAALPESTPDQTVLSLEISPEPGAVAHDGPGRQVALWESDDLQPGEQLVVRWVCEAVLHPRRDGLPLDRIGTLSEVPQEVATDYLADLPLYALQSDVVRAASAAAVSSPTSIADLLEQILGYISSAIEYRAEGGWDAADVILERGSGSASEYAFATIGLCRLWGVPARYAGGLRCAEGDGFYVDRTWHRWVEVYVPGLGWCGMDPVRSERLGGCAETLGGAPDGVLQVSHGDGAGDSMIGLHYLSWHTWSGDDEDVSIIRRGWSFVDLNQVEREAVVELRDRIQTAAEPEQVRQLLESAAELGSPFVLPWIEDLLYDPGLRVDAAETMAAIGGSRALLPLIDSLGRLDDPETDTGVARILRDLTGADLGIERDAWYQWLGSEDGRQAARGEVTR